LCYSLSLQNKTIKNEYSYTNGRQGQPFASKKVENIGFIIGDFGEETEKQLLEIADTLGAKGHIYHQDKPLGTAHAILCAKPLLNGNTLIAFADTLFDADYKFDVEQDGIIVVQQVKDPSAFGVVQLDDEGYINNFVEKPDTFVSDLAIITNALENMKQKGTKFATGQVNEWLDCGNKNATVYTNQRILELVNTQEKLMAEVTTNNAVIIDPCFIAENVTLTNSVVGPHVSIGANTVVENCIIKNTIIQSNTQVKNKVLENSMLGNIVNEA